jgi:hypothetical protein
MGTATLTFGAKLKAHLEENQIGVRTLALGLAKGDKAKREGIRRRLNKYIHENVTPSVPARHEIEQELGLSEDALKGDLEDEEDPAMHMAFDLFMELFDRVLEAREARKERV